KGYTAHVTDMDREKYCNELNREAFLTGMGFQGVSFAYDDVAKRPDQCIYLLRTVLSRYEAESRKNDPEFYLEREILRLAVFLARPIRPIDVSDHIAMNYRTTVKHLQRLCQKNWLKPVIRGKGHRILYYEVTRKGLEHGL